jgi:hypothetical protein
VILVQPFIVRIFARNKEWAALYGLVEEIVRCLIGREDINFLQEESMDAYEITKNARHRA